MESVTALPLWQRLLFSLLTSVAITGLIATVLINLDVELRGRWYWGFFVGGCVLFHHPVALAIGGLLVLLAFVGLLVVVTWGMVRGRGFRSEGLGDHAPILLPFAWLTVLGALIGLIRGCFA